MARYDRRLSRLYRLLDESGLEWLSEEVRAFSSSGPDHQVHQSMAAELRARSRLSADVTPQLDIQPATKIEPTMLPQQFEACVLYVVKRIQDTAKYLENALATAEELGINSVLLGEEAAPHINHFETVRQLREIAVETAKFATL